MKENVVRVVPGSCLMSLSLHLFALFNISFFLLTKNKGMKENACWLAHVPSIRGTLVGGTIKLWVSLPFEQFEI